MPVIYSITQLKQMLDAFWFDNTNRSINGTDPNVWLKKMLDSCCGAKKIITGITAVATASVNISALKTGDVLGGKTLSTGDMIFLPAQTDASENGLYIVGENAGETERHLDFADAASCDGYFLVLASPQAGVGSYFSVKTDSGDGISFNGDQDLSSYTQKWTPLTITTDFATAPASTSTVTMNTDQTANIKAGMALKYKIGGVDYFGIATTVAAGLLTVGGAPLGGNITELSYSKMAGQTEMIAFVLPGACLATASVILLKDFLKTQVRWEKQEAYVVYFATIVNTDDSGATQPHVNVQINGTPLSTSNTNEGLTVAETWVSTVVDINTTNYLWNFRESLNLSTDAIGTNDDASDVTVQIIIVYP